MKMKVITVTHIDNCSHGYYSISKKDVERLGMVNKITGCSGMSLTRVYLEEDCDGSLLYNTAKELGYELNIKDGYNPNFKIVHNYRAHLFSWVPSVDDIVHIGGNKYTIVELLKNNIIVVDKHNNRYRISKSNPFIRIVNVEVPTETKI